MRVRKSRFAVHRAPVGGGPEGGVVFLRLSSDPWTHGARCLVVAKWWPSWPVGHVVLPIVVVPPRSGNRDEALFVVECLATALRDPYLCALAAHRITAIRREGGVGRGVRVAIEQVVYVLG